MASRKSRNAWEHKLFRLPDFIGIITDCRPVANEFKGLLHAAKVAHPVVDDDDVVHGGASHFGGTP